VPEPPDGRSLIEPLKGEAFIAHGEVLLESGDASGALQAAMFAEALLGRILMGQMETAHAKLLRAKAYGALERDARRLISSTSVSGSTELTPTRSITTGRFSPAPSFSARCASGRRRHTRCGPPKSS